MSLAIGQTIKQTDVINGLTSNSSKYLNDTLNFTLLNIKSQIYSKSVLLKDSFKPEYICKDIKAPTTQQILDGVISQTPNVITFDALSTMAVNAFLPLTNIRYSEFKIYENKGTPSTPNYVQTTSYGNAALKDASILSSTGIYFYDNQRSQSKLLVSSREDFISRGGQSNNLNAIYNNYVKGTVQSPVDGHLMNKAISVSVMDSLIELCRNALNTIRTTLSCRFTDYNINDPNNALSLTYYEKNNGIGNSKSEDYHRFNRVSVKNYSDMWSSSDGEFLGWATTPNATSPNSNYSAGKTFQITSNVKLYPVFRRQYTVTYYTSGKPFLSRGNTYSFKVLEGGSHLIKTIGSNANSPLYYNMNVGGISQTFAGYALTNGGEVVFPVFSHGEMESLTNITKNYNLYPVFNPIDIDLELNAYQCWRVGKLESIETDVPSAIKNSKAQVYNPGTTPYPNGISKDMKYGRMNGSVISTYVPIDCRIPLNCISRFRLTFSGFINEQFCTHCPNADKQAREPENVDSDGYAKVILKKVDLGGVDFSSSIVSYDLKPSSLRNWYRDFISPSNKISSEIKNNLKAYYYSKYQNKWRYNAFTNKKILDNMLFQYSFINKRNDPPHPSWPTQPNDNGTFNCFSINIGSVSIDNCVKIVTNWVDVPRFSSNNSGIFKISFSIEEACSKLGATEPKAGGSYGAVYITNVEIE